jgi:cytochrome c biogenesis protein
VVGACWRFFSSVRLAIVLLLLIGIGAVLGTFLPQLPQQPGMTLVHLEEYYSPPVFALLTFFQVFDLFHSWWFSLLLDLLALNLLACSLPRLKVLRVLWSVPPADPSGISGTRSVKVAWPVGQRPEDRVIGHRLGVVLRKPRGQTRWLFGERGRYSRAGFLLVHVGAVVILAGGALGQLGGLEGSLTLVPGQQSDQVTLEASQGATLTLPFTLFCRDFRIERFAAGGGGIRSYVSELEVRQGGQTLRQARVEVNHPLSHGGYSFYQTSYQNVREQDRALLKISDAQGERTAPFSPGQEVARGADGTVYRLHGGYREQMGTLGQAVRIESVNAAGQVRRFWTFARYPGLVARTHPGAVGIDLLEYQQGYATILSVSRDPGAPLLWVGCALLLIGLAATFLGSHRRVWVAQDVAGVEVVCWAHRNVEAFANSIEARLREA